MVELPAEAAATLSVLQLGSSASAAAEASSVELRFAGMAEDVEEAETVAREEVAAEEAEEVVAALEVAGSSEAADGSVDEGATVHIGTMTPLDGL